MKFLHIVDLNPSISSTTYGVRRKPKLTCGRGGIGTAVWSVPGPVTMVKPTALGTPSDDVTPLTLIVTSRSNYFYVRKGLFILQKLWFKHKHMALKADFMLHLLMETSQRINDHDLNISFVCRLHVSTAICTFHKR